MTDKVQKIKDWISKEQDGLMDAQGNFEYPEHEGAYHILCNLDAYIDTLQEEPKFKVGDTIRLKNDGLEAKVTNIDESGFVYAACEDWEQIIDPSKWEIVHRTKTDVDTAMAEIKEKSRAFTEAHKGETAEEILAQMRGEEPVSEDLEKIVEEIAEPTILNAYGTKELARRLRNTVIYGTSVSKELEEASKEWLAPQLDKSYANYGEAKMMELTHFDGYAMLDAIEFGAKWQKEQMMKDLPKWKKVCPDVGQTILYQDGTNIHLQRFGYEIDLKELDKLPKDE